MATSPRPAPKIVRVARNEAISRHMRRITLDVSAMDGFPIGRESANFKLFLPQPGQVEPLLAGPGADIDPALRPIVRTYTLRRYTPETREAEIEFAVHDDYGPATGWSLHAKPGDRVGMSYPSEPKFVNEDAEWIVFAGDMTALPALAVNFERLPRDMRGYAVLEILDEADRLPLAFPANVDVRWLVNPTPREPRDLLLNAIRELKWLDGIPGIWVAGESGVIKTLKQHFKQERSVAREHIYISGYWQIGLNEDAHQQIKRLDADY